MQNFHRSGTLSFVERSSAIDVEFWLYIRSDNSEEAFTVIEVTTNRVHNLSLFWGLKTISPSVVGDLLNDEPLANNRELTNRHMLELVRELTDFAAKSTTLVTAICRRLKTAGRAASFRCFLLIMKVFF